MFVSIPFQAVSNDIQLFGCNEVMLAFIKLNLKRNIIQLLQLL